MLNLDDLLAFAEDVARSAGQLLLEARARGGDALKVQTKSSAHDFVTEVDLAVQRHVIGRIAERFPTHRFIAEESGAEALGDPASPYAWVIDPLDGTMNFIHGKPTFGSLLALMEKDEVVLGVIAQPAFGKVFAGRRKGGAFLNGKPVRVRATKDMEDAIVCTNIRAQAVPCNGTHHAPVPLAGSLHTYGDATQEMAEILEGWNDGIAYRGVGLWDIASGCLLIEEAGGRARWEFVDAANPRKGVHCVASTKKIFDALESFIFA